MVNPSTSAVGLPAESSIQSWRAWLCFLPFALLSVVHVFALATPNTSPGMADNPLATVTKLGLMPLLALGVVLVATNARVPETKGRQLRALLLLAIALSWLGDSAGVFFPFLPTIPMMLAFFALAHLAYIALLGRGVARHAIPRWAAVFGLWWLVLVILLWPHLGALAVPTAGYGIVLAGTAVAATRCRPMIVVGALLFLTSDTLLAFRLFIPDAVPDWTSPAVMATYCLGQGLIVAGVVADLVGRTRETAQSSLTAPHVTA